MSKIEINSLARFKLRSDTGANWETNNPVLLSGEIGIEVETGRVAKIKVGDGVTEWNNLPYYGDVSEQIASEATAREAADEALASQIPAKTSDLTNDSGYLTLETLPKYNGEVQS